jgi:hypothetical protein
MEQIEIKGEDVVCEVCGRMFYVSASEQLRLKQIGIIPRRCLECRKAHRRVNFTEHKSNFSDTDFRRVMDEAAREIQRWKQKEGRL